MTVNDRDGSAVCERPKNLVVSTVGDRSFHRSWVDGTQPRSFDLLLVYFGDDAGYAFGPAEYTFRKKGFKYQLIASVLEENPEIFDRYDSIWCPDDDIATDQKTIDRLFHIFNCRRFSLAQPAIGLGEVSYRSLRQCPNTAFRYSPFVEVMCPIFSREAFQKTSTLFRETQSGWGIDWIWSKWFSPRELAIIDETAVHHTGKLLKGELYQKLNQRGINPGAEFNSVVSKYGGINERHQKRMVRGRMLMNRVPLPGYRRSFWERISASYRWAA